MRAGMPMERRAQMSKMLCPVQETLPDSRDSFTPWWGTLLSVEYFTCSVFWMQAATVRAASRPVLQEETSGAKRLRNCSLHSSRGSLTTA